MEEKREIKFRAWDNLKKQLLTEGIMPNLFMIIGQPNDFELMQFTGLKDKNGKEIFEGDIVKWKDYGRRSYRLYLIIWSEENANFYLKTIKNSNRNSVPDDRIYRTDTESEIIGNIYENPELLVEKE